MSDPETLLRIYRTLLEAFSRFAARELHPNRRTAANWHQTVIADAITTCLEGDDRRLIVNAPPSCLEAVTSAAALAIFTLGRDPTRRIILVGGGRETAGELKHACFTLFKSQRVQAVFPHLQAKETPYGFDIAHGGSVRCSAMNGSPVAPGTDLVVVVDPISAADAQHPKMRKQVSAFFDAEIRARAGSAAVIVLMARQHRDDLTGHLRRASEAWTHVKLPGIATVDEEWTLADGRTVLRRKGEALHPELQNRDDLEAVLIEIDALLFSAQIQQAPLQTDRLYRSGAFIEPKVDWELWKVGEISPRFWLGPMAEKNYILHELFGGPEPDQPWRPELGPTQEQWEEGAIRQQRRLIAEAMKSIEGDPPEEWRE